ncbi:MAG: hypothetical protein KAR44_07680 [Candidatus Aegiribacteria sp.]|nr:hypothetical protein [Candidatus Aegiribacteria sp.]
MMYLVFTSEEPGHKVDFHRNITLIVNNVGGLIFAIVVAKLAITKRGKNPLLIMNRTKNMPSRPATGLALIYAIVWILTGLSCLVVGVMLYPGANKTISDIGTSWIGVSVAAGYSYFGVNP